jgi:peptide-methionine (S)-S-oxide reductase
MSTLQLVISFGLAFTLAFAADVAHGQESKDQGEKPSKPKLEEATFGGGCFWCTEAFFERLPGVKSVVSGYSGGNVPNPTYEMISTGLTGHAEVIQITFDPAVIPFETLLDYFWAAHDPTTVDAQGPDHGPQYRSIILYHSEAQKEAAEKAKHALNARRAHKSPVVTEIVPFEAFFPAEGYHQDFARANPAHPYVQAYIVPKMGKLKAKMKAEAEKKAKAEAEAK